MKKQILSRVIMTSMVVVLPLSSFTACETSAGNAGLTTGLLTFAGNIAAGNSLMGSAIAGGLAGYTTYKVVSIYEASIYQRQLAYERGRRAAERRSVRQSRARVVAVRVPKAKTQRQQGTSVMLVNKDTGKPINNKAYVVSSTPKDGEEVKISGTTAVYSAVQGT